jgi:hypothetical protein
MTPVTSHALPLIWMVRPTMPGSAAYRRDHKAWLSTTTLGPLRTSSAAENVRPTIALTPSVENRFALTLPDETRSGSPSPVRFTCPSAQAATSLSVFARRR